MRTSAVLAIIIGCGLIASSAFAQSRVEDPQIVTYIDTPLFESYQAKDHVVFSGWAFHCATGQQPVSLRIRYFSEFGQWIDIPATVTWRQARPDVKAVFLPYCPNLGPFIGWTITFDIEAPALGHRWFSFTWNDQSGSKTQNWAINIAP